MLCKESEQSATCKIIFVAASPVTQQLKCNFMGMLDGSHNITAPSDNNPPFDAGVNVMGLSTSTHSSLSSMVKGISSSVCKSISYLSIIIGGCHTFTCVTSMLMSLKCSYARNIDFLEIKKLLKDVSERALEWQSAKGNCKWGNETIQWGKTKLLTCKWGNETKVLVRPTCRLYTLQGQ